MWKLKKILGIIATGTVIAIGLAACGGGGKAVDVVRKGHFDTAPNITIEELVRRYQYTDPKSVKWELVTDANKNEFVRVSAGFDEEALITVDAEKRFSIRDGTITFNMTSPVYGDDDDSKYDLVLNFKTETDRSCLRDMLVNNADFARSAGINF
jgi:hypothetical protein